MIINNKYRIVIICIITFCLWGCQREEVENTGSHNPYLPENITEDKILSSYSSTGMLDNDYYPIKTRIDEADLIVYGEVKQIEYKLASGGAAWTMEEFIIHDVITGNALQGETLLVAECKGYITVSDFIETHGINEEGKKILRDGYQDLSDQELSERYLKFSDGTPLAEVGDKVVLFLEPSSAWTTIDQPVYEPVAGWFGKYTEMSDGKLAWISPAGMAAAKERSESGEVSGSTTFTMEELKNEIAVASN